MTSYIISAQDNNAYWHDDVIIEGTAHDAYIAATNIEADYISINHVVVTDQTDLDAWYEAEINKASIEELSAEIASIKTALNDKLSAFTRILMAIHDASGFIVSSIDSDYSSVPNGYIAGASLLAFVKEWQLELVDAESNALIVRSEWGNGEGFDYYKISVN